MSRRLLAPAIALLLAASAITALLPAGALADGDPASDVLLGENVFYPYSPPVTAATQKTLNAATAAAKKSGFPLKVALIASPVDLGVIPDLFSKPQKYADFLDQEISFRAKQPLLVVMSSGYGVQGLTPKAKAALATIPPPAGKQSEQLAKAAITAVSKLATASGHPLGDVSGVPGSKSGGSSVTTVIIIVLVAAALATAAALALITVRRRREEAGAA
ncbi:MAG: hypothetical protein ACJ76X_00355 [Solirubrobacteraceae bacterium]|jgi:hypothetical protein